MRAGFLFFDRPIAFFDIESTGSDPAKDRIVSLCVVTLCGTVRSKESWLFNPGVQMSGEVVAIHGITNEMVKDCPAFSGQTAREVYAAFDGSDLGGFNLLNFDVPMLWEEFHRAGITWDLNGVRIVDVGNIFKKKEERTLSAGVRFYCGREHDGAHSASGDVDATIDVLAAQLDRYADLGVMPVADLARFSRFEDRVDLAGKLVRNGAGEIVYGFGKYMGLRVLDERGFAQWMLSKDFSENIKKAVRSILYPQRDLV